MSAVPWEAVVIMPDKTLAPVHLVLKMAPKVSKVPPEPDPMKLVLGKNPGSADAVVRGVQMTVATAIVIVANDIRCLTRLPLRLVASDTHVRNRCGTSKLSHSGLSVELVSCPLFRVRLCLQLRE